MAARGDEVTSMVAGGVEREVLGGSVCRLGCWNAKDCWLRGAQEEAPLYGNNPTPQRPIRDSSPRTIVYGKGVVVYRHN